MELAPPAASSVILGVIAPEGTSSVILGVLAPPVASFIILGPFGTRIQRLMFDKKLLSGFTLLQCHNLNLQ